jgi:signal transduction histidine kinase
METSCLETKPERTNFYLHEYDPENRLAYRIYTESLTGSIVKRMSGILAATFLIIILLSYAFWYFIRTVVHLKSLEEMKSDFTNNMTHELKTPLAVAYSAVDTLLNFKQGENRDKRNQYLQICIEQLSHLSVLVEQILCVSMERTRKITLNKETVELKPFIAQIASNHTLKANKPVDIHIDIQPETLSVHADATHLNNIINNLIDNAVKYATPEEAVEITVASYMEKEFCILSVKDNGMGISPENQKLIFDRFYRVPQGNLHDVKGFGLGLSYVKSIVERHGGCITVKSALHKGAEFIIKIPQR